MNRLKVASALLRETFQRFNEDKAVRLGAALAYYSVFSMGPLVVIAVAIAGLAFGPAVVQGQVYDTIQSLVGTTGVTLIKALAQAARHPRTGIAASVVGVVMLILGAAGVFGGLKDALNTIWGVAPKPGRTLWEVIRQTFVWNFLSVAAVLGTGFLLLVSLIVNAVVSATSVYLQSRMPGGMCFWQGVDLGASFAIVALIFALMFKYLPQARIAWRDVGLGAIVTALLFEAGKYALGVYLGAGSFSSIYGAAASVMVVLIWVFYSAQIVLFGAEFTKVWADHCGSRVVPRSDAVAVSPEMRARQGIPTQAQLTANKMERHETEGLGARWARIRKTTASIRRQIETMGQSDGRPP